MDDKTTKRGAIAGAAAPVAGLSYAVVEAAIAAVFGIDPAGQRGWLRARLQHLRRLGFVPASPGKGSAIVYTMDDAIKWLLVMELEHLLIDPVKAVELVRGMWTAPPQKRRAVTFTKQESLHFQIERARKAVAPEDHVMLLVVFGPLSTPPAIGFTTAATEAGRLVARDDRDPAPARVAVRDLTALIKAFDNALAKAQKPVPPDPAGLAGEILRAGRRARGEIE